MCFNPLCEAAGVVIAAHDSDMFQLHFSYPRYFILISCLLMAGRDVFWLKY
jgi:hypothetical protein